MFMGVLTQPLAESRQTKNQALSPPKLTELGTTKTVGQEVTELGTTKPVGQVVTELGTTKPVGQEVTELVTTKPVGQEVTELGVAVHEEKDIELENNAAAHDPDPKEILNMLGQQATWEKVPTFSDSNDEKRHRVIKSDRDDSKHVKPAADNLHDDMERSDNPGNQQAKTNEGEDEEDEEDNDNESAEMTAEEKEEMRNAVRDGDVDRLEDLLDRPGGDIRMIYLPYRGWWYKREYRSAKAGNYFFLFLSRKEYRRLHKHCLSLPLPTGEEFQENLLMTAIRAGQVHMAEFLLDNGVDQNFSTTLLNLKDSRGASPYKKLECYKYSCRQMAYDKGLLDIVEIIDLLNGRLFPGVKPRPRFPRYRRLPKSPSSGDDASDDDSDGELLSTSANQSNVPGPGAENHTRTSSKDGAEALPGGGAKGSEGQSVTLKRSSKTLELGTEVKDVPETSLHSETLHVKCSHHSNDMGAEENDEGKKDRGKKKSAKRKENEKQREGTGGEEETTSKHSAASKNLLEEKTKEADSKDMVGKPEDGKRFMEPSDEGYETMSPSPSWPPLKQQQLPPKDQPLAIQTKATKGFMGLKRATENHLHSQLTARYNEARPLRWRKVKSPGSYIVESPLWHQSLPSHLIPQISSQVDIQLSSPSSSSSSSCSYSTSVTEKRSAKVTVEFESIEVLEDNSITVPKILRPSPRVFSSSESSASGSASPSSTPRSSTSSAMTYPLKQRVANYMRMTASSFVKRRLEPSFSQSYSSLDFVHSTSKTGNGSSRHLNESLSSARSTDNSERKLDVTCRQAGHIGHLTRDVQVSPTNGCAANYKLGPASDTNSRLLERTVPSIRNNSSVVQVSRQTSSFSKSR